MSRHAVVLRGDSACISKMAGGSLSAACNLAPTKLFVVDAFFFFFLPY
jgi:hypothetical protein